MEEREEEDLEVPEEEADDAKGGRRPLAPDVVKQPSPPAGPVPIPYPNRYER